MAITVKSSGTETPTIDVESFLATNTDGNTYVFVVNTENMVNGDVIKLKIYTKVLSSTSTSNLAYSVNYADVQATPNIYSVPVPANKEIKISLEQTDTTARSFDWALLALD